MTEFKLHTSGDDNHRFFSQGKRNIIKKTFLKYWSKLQDEVGDASVGSGLFHKGRNKSACDGDVYDDDDSETKSCTESVSDQWSVIGSKLFHKEHSKKNDDENADDIEDSETKSILVSFLNPSSSIGSASCNEFHDENKDENFDCDIEHAETKVIPKLVSKTSPVAISTSHHKFLNKNEDDDDDADADADVEHSEIKQSTALFSKPSSEMGKNRVVSDSVRTRMTTMLIMMKIQNPNQVLI